MAGAPMSRIWQVWVRASANMQSGRRDGGQEPRNSILWMGVRFKTILYSQDAAGDENFHLFAVDLDSDNVRDLTPWQGVRAESVAADPEFPDPY